MLSTNNAIKVTSYNQLPKIKQTIFSFNSIKKILTIVLLCCLQSAYANNNSDIEIVTIYADRKVDDPGALSIINTDKIEIINADHPAEIVNQAPGVNVQMNSGQENLIAIRSPVLTGGAGQGSFLLLENGVPIRASAFGNVNALFEIFHESADSIEIIRGPASAKYGSNAVHGLINVMHDIATAPDQIQLSASTLNRYRMDFEVNSNEGKKIALSIQDDYGWRDSTNVKQQKFLFTSKLNLNNWLGEAWLSATNLEQETADFLQGVDAYKNKAFAKTNDDPNAGRYAWSVHTAANLSKNIHEGYLTIKPYFLMQKMSFIQHFLPNRGL